MPATAAIASASVVSVTASTIVRYLRDGGYRIKFEKRHDPIPTRLERGCMEIQFTRENGIM